MSRIITPSLSGVAIVNKRPGFAISNIGWDRAQVIECVPGNAARNKRIWLVIP